MLTEDRGRLTIGVWRVAVQDEEKVVAEGLNKPVSALVLEEYFASGSEAFLAALWGFSEPKKLAGLVDRWKVDPRP